MHVQGILTLAAAGAAGTVARYAISRWTHQLFGDGFAFGTLAVNALGCLALGFVVEGVLLGGNLNSHWRLSITVGFFGAFTTFSTFSHETISYLEKGAWGMALTNVTANLLLCLVATWGGLAAGRAAFGES